ncbi:MAG: hypothetical protein BWY69_00073 [Planctomycetes bacterium ADurb.Bin401]|nr:MAG: hypothetical protein BWY69_00073 [Planctomycetes bacterium ADurb.Bin401]
MGKRLVKWFTYTVLFAFIPLASSILMKYLAGRLSFPSHSDIPEFIFFSLMVSSTSIGDLLDFLPSKEWGILLRITWSALLFSIIASAVMYGSYVYENTLSLGPQVFKDNLLFVSMVLSAVLFALTLVIQIFIGKAEQAK